MQSRGVNNRGLKYLNAPEVALPLNTAEILGLGLFIFCNMRKLLPI